MLKDVPPNATVVGVPGRIVVQDGKRVNKDLDHGNLPDPIADRMQKLEEQIKVLQQEVQRLKEERSLEIVNKNL